MVTPERAGLIEPETMIEPPMVRLEEETSQEMVLEILHTVKDADELIAPSCVVSPLQLADMFQEPATSGV